MVTASLFVLLFIIPSVFGGGNILRVVGNGEYSGLTVKFRESVPRHLCFRTLNKLQELLTETSREFHRLTSGRGLFKDVNVILPESWSGTECLTGRNISLSSSSFSGDDDSAADIFVTDRHPIFGNEIWTLQYGQCGVPGQKIDLPYPALMANKTLSGKLIEYLLTEWIKYRFGVFSEAGFRGDSLYPEYLVDGEIKYLNSGCNESEEVICPEEGYNHDVTTKQNILCNGKSVREIMNDSKDLNYKITVVSTNRSETRMEKRIFTPPTFKFILPQSKLFVLILDRSSGSALEDDDEDQTHWEVLQQALFQFITRVPVGAQLSIVTYGENEATLNLPPTLITEDNREGLHGRIPRRSLREKSNISCLNCAMKMALKIARTSNNSNLRFVLATGSTITGELSREHLEEVRNLSLPIYAVSMSTNALGMPLKDLTAFGQHYVVSRRGLISGPTLYLTELSNTLSTILRVSSDVSIVPFLRELQYSDSDNSVSGNFVVEEKLRQNLWIVVTAEDERDIELFEILSPTGRKYSFPTFEHSLAYFHLKGLNEPGIWSYSIKLYQTLISRYPVHVEVLGEPNDENSITLKSWIHVDRSGQDDHTKVFLYAEVKQGILPVLDADVRATVIVPPISGPDEVAENVEVILRDLGTGYPDITQGDGIYSAYFTDFSAVSGYYRMSVVADHNSGNARTPKLSAALESKEENDECCGSSLPVSYTIPTNPFRRVTIAPSFYVEQTASFYVRQGSRQVNDIYPPSRITDFKLEKYNTDESLFVSLTWTAPGGDYDHGAAFRYEIRCYTSREALRDENFSEMSIPVHATLIPRPEKYGTEQRCTVGVPWANEVFYYAIVAYDESGNRGRISNAISVYIKEEASTLAPPPQPSVLDHNSLEGSSNGTLFEEAALVGSYDADLKTYIVAGIVSLVLVLIIIGTAIGIVKYTKIIMIHNSKDDDMDNMDKPSNLTGTLKKIMTLPDVTPEKGRIWSGGSSPTHSDYSSSDKQHREQSTNSETVSWNSYKQGLQKATSQELPGIHKQITTGSDCYVRFESETMTMATTNSPSRTTQYTDCSIYESDPEVLSSTGSNQQRQQQHQVMPPTRISIMEDYSVYRDLSNLSCKQNFSFSQIPAELLQCGSAHMITVPPYYDVSTLDTVKKRHESLV